VKLVLMIIYIYIYIYISILGILYMHQLEFNQFWLSDLCGTQLKSILGILYIHQLEFNQFWLSDLCGTQLLGSVTFGCFNKNDEQTFIG
jgi:hypothetical protein